MLQLNARDIKALAKIFKQRTKRMRKEGPGVFAAPVSTRIGYVQMEANGDITVGDTVIHNVA